MSIWRQRTTPAELQVIHQPTLANAIGICFEELGADYLSATLPLDARTRDAAGAFHSGAIAVLAETIGSIAANLCVDPVTEVCVGQALVTQHLRCVRTGPLRARATPVDIGARTHRWQIDTQTPDGTRAAVSMLTMMVIPPRRPRAA